MSGLERRRTRVSEARRLAYETLSRVEERAAFAQDVLSKVVDASEAPEAERAFATRLVLGAVAMRGTLDAVLDRCMRSPGDARPDLRRALRISVYEVLYLDKEPHAAVDQGVELAKWVAPRAGGLANAVLRKVVQAKHDFPFGDPVRDLSAFSLLEGFPQWLTETLADDLGVEGVRAFERASNEPAPIFLFENALKQGAGAAGSTFGASVGERVTQLRGVDLPGCVRVLDRRALAGEAILQAIGEGRALVSDASAQAVASICATLASAACRDEVSDMSQLSACGPKGPAEEVSVLELCAGRGTKTVMIQSDVFRALGRQAERYVALDNVPFKCELLERRAERYGVRVDEVACEQLDEASEVVAGGGGFDVVFLDAPCSGLGTLRRHPEIRWRMAPKVVSDAATLDGVLLRAASRNVRPGGFLVYATCTVTHAENEGAVQEFLESATGAAFGRVSVFGEPHFAPVLVPGGPDAHFCCVMQRRRD